MYSKEGGSGYTTPIACPQKARKSKAGGQGGEIVAWTEKPDIGFLSFDSLVQRNMADGALGGNAFHKPRVNACVNTQSATYSCQRNKLHIPGYLCRQAHRAVGIPSIVGPTVESAVHMREVCLCVVGYSRWH